MSAAFAFGEPLRGGNWPLMNSQSHLGGNPANRQDRPACVESNYKLSRELPS